MIVEDESKPAALRVEEIARLLGLELGDEERHQVRLEDRLLDLTPVESHPDA